MKKSKRSGTAAAVPIRARSRGAVPVGALRAVLTVAEQLRQAECLAKVKYSGCRGRDLLRYEREVEAISVSQPLADPLQTARLLTIGESIRREIDSRIERYLGNRLLGEYLLGDKTGDLERQNKALRALYRYGLGIVKRHGWHHFEGRDRWEQIINDFLVVTAKKYDCLCVEETRERILDYEFNFVGRALECDFQDELRNVYRRLGLGRESSFEDYTVSHEQALLEIDPAQSEAFAEHFESKAARFEAEGSLGAARMWRLYARYLRDPQGWEALFGTNFEKAARKADRELNRVSQKISEKDWQKAAQKVDGEILRVRAIVQAMRAQWEKNRMEQSKHSWGKRTTVRAAQKYENQAGEDRLSASWEKHGFN